MPSRSIDACGRCFQHEVQLYDPIPALCGKGCGNEAVIELLRDTDHLSTAGCSTAGGQSPDFLRQVRLPSSS